MEFLPILYQFCKYCPLRIGATIISVICTLIHTTGLFMNLFYLNNFDIYVDSCQESTGLMCALLMEYWEHAMLIFLNFLELVLSGVVGLVVTNERLFGWLLIVPVYGYILFPTWLFMHMIMYIVIYPVILVSLFLTYLIFIFLGLYVVIVYNSYYLEIKRNRETLAETRRTVTFKSTSILKKSKVEVFDNDDE